MGTLDSAYTLRCFEENLRPLAEHYFGAQLIDWHHFPIDELGKRAIILVANHSGMGLSWDNIILDFLVYDRLRLALGDRQRAIDSKAVRLVDPLFLTHRAVDLFGIKHWWRRTGCVAATSSNFETAVQQHRIIIISPEGVAGIAKGPHRKYQLQRFSSSFLRMAHTHHAMVVPISVVNAEYLNPANISLSKINSLGRKFGYPFVPIGGAALQAILPATYLVPRPAKLTYVMHPPVHFDSNTVRTYPELRAEAETFRQEHQLSLNHAVRVYHAPYNRRASQSSVSRKILKPHHWHEMFLKTAGEPNWLAALYKVPIGYPLISVAKRVSQSKRDTNYTRLQT